MLQVKAIPLSDQREIDKTLREHPPILSEGNPGIQVSGNYLLVFYSDEGALDKNDYLQMLYADLRQQQRLWLQAKVAHDFFFNQTLVRRSKQVDEGVQAKLQEYKQKMDNAAAAVRNLRNIIKALNEGELELP